MLGPVWFGLMLDHGLAPQMFIVVAVLLARRDHDGAAGAARHRRQLTGVLTMDLGIAGKRALVCAREQGTRPRLRAGARRRGLRRHDRRAHCAGRGARGRGDRRARRPHRRAGSRATSRRPEGREAALRACPQPDILVNNAGGPPPGDFRDWTRDDWIRALDANMLTPIELIKATIDGMIARRFGRIVNITSAAVKAPIDILGLSNGARSGLTGFVAGLARKVARTTSRSTTCCRGRSTPIACAA